MKPAEYATTTFWFLSLLGLINVVVIVDGASCNVCGCEGCKVGQEDTLVRYPNPSKPNEETQSSCEALYLLASNRNDAFTQDECDELYKVVTPRCACFYPNGTDVAPYGGRIYGDNKDQDFVEDNDSYGVPNSDPSVGLEVGLPSRGNTKSSGQVGSNPAWVVSFLSSTAISLVFVLLSL